MGDADDGKARGHYCTSFVPLHNTNNHYYHLYSWILNKNTMFGNPVFSIFWIRSPSHLCKLQLPTIVLKKIKLEKKSYDNLKRIETWLKIWVKTKSLPKSLKSCVFVIQVFFHLRIPALRDF